MPRGIVAGAERPVRAKRAEPAGSGLKEDVPLPYNPFLTSGSLVLCSLLGKGLGGNKRFPENGRKFTFIMDALSACAGSKVGFSNATFLALKERSLKVRCTHMKFDVYLCDIIAGFPLGTYVFIIWLSVLCMRSKAWLAARVSLRLARLPRTASSAQCSRRLRSTRAAAPVLLAHAEVTKNIIF